MAIQFTANFAFPYPALDRSDSADVPRDVAALAVRNDQVALSLRRDDLIGEMKIWPIAAPPAGFLLADGSLRDRVGTYAALFAAIGTTFNVGGEAGDKFRLPDARGRTLFGVDGAANRLTVFEALGDAWGYERIVLTRNEMPTHYHDTSDITIANSGSHNHSGNTTDVNTDHTHNYAATQPNIVGFPAAASGAAQVGEAAEATAGMNSNAIHHHGIASDGVHSHAISGHTGTDGDQQSHNNMPPYLVINYIIRYV